MTQPKWNMLNPKIRPEHLGFLPSFLDDDNPAPAKQQLNDNYGHGGGWSPFKGFTFSPGTFDLCYPGDPPQKLVAETYLREEHILLYDCAWVVIIQPDGSWEVARMD